LALKNKTELKFDIRHYDAGWGSYNIHVMNIQENFATQDEISHFKKFRKKPGRRWFFRNLLYTDGSKYVEEKKPFEFDPSVLEKTGDIYLDGWWQNEKYFIDIRDILLKELVVKEPATGENKSVADKITATNSVSIHVRRKDFITNPKISYIYGELTQKYYSEALDYISSRIKDIKIFVFSDDIAWVQKNMPFPFETTHVSQNNTEELAYQDLRLMSLCKHHIIANSTFSWWGAWLGQEKNKIVVGPKKWWANDTRYNSDNLLLKEWVKI